MKRYIVTWEEDREAEVFATSEGDATIIAMTRDGRWTHRHHYNVMEVD